MKICLCILYLLIANHLIAQTADSTVNRRSVSVDSSTTAKNYPMLSPRYPLLNNEVNKQHSKISVSKTRPVLLNWTSADARFLKDPKKKIEEATIFTEVAKTLLQGGLTNGRQ